MSGPEGLFSLPHRFPPVSSNKSLTPIQHRTYPGTYVATFFDSRQPDPKAILHRELQVTPYLRNYVTAMVELAAYRRDVPPPASNKSLAPK
jgi:hypothetical protein